MLFGTSARSADLAIVIDGMRYNAMRDERILRLQAPSLLASCRTPEVPST